jgi:hypothetical protein
MNLRLPLYLCILTILAVFNPRVHAQESNASPAARLSFLSADDRAHFLKVRQQVLDSNADLKAEQDSLDQERKFVKDKGADATADDKKTLFQNMIAHGKKMQGAMRAADPTIGPVLDQIDAKMKERMQSLQGQGNGSGT